jgi:hypothetical protein
MKKISAIPEIPNLLVRAKLIEQITSMLIEPFNSIDEADQLWGELKC